MTWLPPEVSRLEGQQVTATRLDTIADLDDLYELSHADEKFKKLWTYMFVGPFQAKARMGEWLTSIEKSADPLFFTVTDRGLNRKVGMFSLLNIAPAMGRVELGNIWYGPLVQKTKVNTETTFLFLKYLFDDLHYRRVEWKCDNRNEPSKKAALRMGFKYEGLFRQHMMVKGQNRDTAWFSMIDEEWPAKKENFRKYLAGEARSLTALNPAPGLPL